MPRGLPGRADGGGLRLDGAEMRDAARLAGRGPRRPQRHRRRHRRRPASRSPATGWSCLGRVVAHKRVDLVVRAFARVLADGAPDVTLDVIGTGAELDRVRGDGRRPRPRRRRCGCTASCPTDEKSRVLDARRRLHVCASDAEGWGQVVLEAAAHGLPTLARDVPGHARLGAGRRDRVAVAEPPTDSHGGPGRAARRPASRPPWTTWPTPSSARTHGARTAAPGPPVQLGADARRGARRRSRALDRGARRCRTVSSRVHKLLRSSWLGGGRHFC